LENQQAIVKQFSEIIEFVLKFDEYKVRAKISTIVSVAFLTNRVRIFRPISASPFQMRTPAIQNDFSYYRRMLMREGTAAHSFTDQDEDSNSNLNVANKVSLFYAEATPMLRTLSNVTSQYLNKVRITRALPKSS